MRFNRASSILVLAAAASLVYLRAARAPVWDDPELGLFECGAGEALRTRFQPASLLSVSMSLPLTSVTATDVCRAAADRPGGLSGILPKAAEGLKAGGVLLAGAALGGAPWALASTAAYGATPYEIDRTPTCFSMPLSAALLLLLAGLLALRAQRPSRALTGLCAAAAGAGLMVRSPLALFAPLLAALELRRGRRSRPSPGHAVLLLAVPPLFVAPWALMNWCIQRRLILFEFGRPVKNVVQSSLGLVRYVPGDVAILMRQAEPAWPAVPSLGWAAGHALLHPAPFVSAAVSRASWIVSLHPWLWLAAAAAVVLRRRRQDLLAVALLAAYFFVLHSGVSITEMFVMPLTPLLAVLAGGLIPPKLERPAPGAALAALSGMLIVALVWCARAFVWEAQAAWAARAAPLGSEAALETAVAREPRNPWLINDCLLRGLPRACSAADVAGALDRTGLYPEFETRLAWLEARQGHPKRLLRLTPRGAPTETGPYLKDALRLDAYQAAALLSINENEAARRKLEDLLEKGKRECGHATGLEAAAERAAFEKMCGAPAWPDAAQDAMSALDAPARRRFSRELLAALSRRPAAIEDAQAVAAVALAAGQPSEAAGYLSRLPEPVTAEEALRQALLWRAAGRLDGGLRLVDSAIARLGETQELLVEQGIERFELGDPDEAEASLRRALVRRPEDLSAAVSLGAVLLSRGREDQALAVYDAAVAGAARSGDAALRARILHDRDQLLKAKARPRR